MKAKILILGCLVVLTQMVSAQQETLTNKTVTDLFKAGLDNSIIVSKIESSTCKFDLSSTGLMSLKKAGIPADIIKTMMAKSADKSSPVQPPPHIMPIQHEVQYPAIDLIYIPYGYNTKTNVLTTLEKSTVSIKGKITLKSVVVPGLGSVPIVYKLDGDKSPVRISSADSALFLVNMGTYTPDAFGLYHMTPKNSHREALYMKAGAMNNKGDKDVVAFNFKKVKEGIYEIIPTTKLAPGEYCFLNRGSMANYAGSKADVYAFGID